MLASLLLLSLVTVTTAFLFDLVNLGVRRTEMYNPEREALVEADWQLSQTMPHGPASITPVHRTERHIRKVLDWLDKAEGMQSEHRQRIAVLRDKVEALAAAERAVQSSSAHRDRLYDEISSELRFLIDRYGEGPPNP